MPSEWAASFIINGCDRLQSGFAFDTALGASKCNHGVHVRAFVKLIGVQLNLFGSSNIAKEIAGARALFGARTEAGHSGDNGDSQNDFLHNVEFLG